MPAINPMTGFVISLLINAAAFSFGVPADLPDHDHGFRLLVVFEHLKQVDVARADDGIAANAHAGRLTKP